jgi:Mg2+-importing ATPase
LEPRAIDAFWAHEVDVVASALTTDVRRGLSTVEAARRLVRFGPNALRPARRATWLRAFGSQLRNPLVLLLVGAAGLSAMLRDWTDAGVVITIVVASTLLGTFHEWRASAAVEKLRASVRIETRVFRDGVERVVAAAEIVPGDVVRLAAGTLVPGDALLLDAHDLFVAEALLSGESFPVEKRVGVVNASAPIAARTNAVFFGTSVRSGTATALIVRTGRATELGRIARALVRTTPETAFEAGLRRFGVLLTEMTVGLVFLVVIANVVADRPPVEALLFALALAVGMSPELLPAILSVTLARGAMGMAKRGVIVKRLSAIETFGAMDVLCTDKTGTLTEGVVGLDSASDVDGHPSDHVLCLARLNAELQTGLPSPLDDAIVRAAKERSIAALDGTKRDEIPYDFERKRIGIVVERDDGSGLLVVKGAVASVVAACTRARRGAEIRAYDDVRAAVAARVEAWTTSGLRVLAVASREVEPSTNHGPHDEHDLVLEGLLAFFDPPKEGCAEVVRAIRGLGIELKIVTGDSLGVAMHVARALEIPLRGTLTGAQLAKVRDAALVQLAHGTTIFAEVDPEQKERIVRALRRRGHVVGYLGDGINDAAALHMADVAVSVDGAADVAKEAADFVLGRRDLDVLRAGVEAGRTTFANTLKYIRTTASANLGNMVSMALASLWLPFLPLTATQILLGNVLEDVPLTLLAGDAVDQEFTAQPEGWALRDLRAFMIVFGLVSSSFDLLTFAALRALGAGVDEFRTAWFVESLLTALATPYVTRTMLPTWRSRPSAALAVASLAIASFVIALPYLPLGVSFALVPLSPSWLGVVALITLGYLVALELTKALWWTRRYGRASVWRARRREHDADESLQSPVDGGQNTRNRPSGSASSA